ncbi:sigma-54-dependent transcriptional regulator [Salinivirga cyanobacteriivorans]|uniref:Transcriptional regulatory protein ZraR n=1 Tax=Salinivirga cyanobacteriivorans TaxID=1307839 RepID=A0A0S2I4X5_9BACT|nr:sigma-54 dependent transcriptional regulator [Salinivirga cyanobacteriivorans]ALO17298.1 Transcriptional regulatory protein ZraR [Salinivirga cyanobacteriivorans]
MSKHGNILIVDDNEDILFSLKLLLKHHVNHVEIEPNPDNIPDLMQERDYDVILLDMNFSQDASSGQEGYYWLEKILKIDPQAVVVFITAYGNTDKAVQAIKAGATDFILKPFQNEKIIATVNSSLRLRFSQEEVSTERNRTRELSAATDQPFKDFIGVAPKMKQVFSTINKVAGTDASVLITGENGTGKEVVARSLHRNSTRKDSIFVNVDLGAIPDTLFESELFGHEKGAFTDAKDAKPGRFEVASGGTLFLDEIGNLTLPLQAKLLTAIERRQVKRLGAKTPKDIDIRLICATNASIYDMVDNGEFRQDLLYRINTVEIELPPLRERIEDIPLLADHYLKIFGKKYKKRIRKVSAAAMKELEMYSWPGNIRELQHAIERAVIMAEGTMLEPDDFVLYNKSKAKSDMEFDTFDLDEVEKKVIKKVLDKTHGNISHAARELGLTRTSLYRRMEKHGL